MKPLTCGPKVVPSRLCHVIKHSEWSCLSNLCLPRPNIHIALLQEVSLTPNEARAFGRSVVKKGSLFILNLALPSVVAQINPVILMAVWTPRMVDW